MAVNVNPPPKLQIPKEFQGNALTTSYFRQIETILFQLWKRTGGTTDDVSDSKDNITSSSSRVSRNAARINSLELRQFEIVTTTTDIQTEEFQVIICRNASEINVTLNPEAVEDDEVHIKRRDGVVNVIGQIDGLTDKTINVKNYSMHLVFDGTDWNEI